MLINLYLSYQSAVICITYQSKQSLYIQPVSRRLGLKVKSVRLLERQEHKWGGGRVGIWVFGARSQGLRVKGERKKRGWGWRGGGGRGHETPPPPCEEKTRPQERAWNSPEIRERTVSASLPKKPQTHPRPGGHQSLCLVGYGEDLCLQGCCE